MPEINVTEADFALLEREIFAVRCAVFIVEQDVPIDQEIDNADPFCRHVLVFENEQPIGTGRLLDNGHIGRVAVLKQYRHQGIGLAIMQKLEAIAKTIDLEHIYLSAQTSAIGFYEKLGYYSYGEIYMEVDIPHIRMKKPL